MQKLILNYTRLRLHEHTHLKRTIVMYIIYIGDMHTKKVNECAVTSERSVFRIANSNVMSTSRGFRYIVSVFCCSGVLSGIRGKQMIRSF